MCKLLCCTFRRVPALNARAGPGTSAPPNWRLCSGVHALQCIARPCGSYRGSWNYDVERQLQSGVYNNSYICLIICLNNASLRGVGRGAGIGVAGSLQLVAPNSPTWVDGGGAGACCLVLGSRCTIVSAADCNRAGPKVYMSLAHRRSAGGYPDSPFQDPGPVVDDAAAGEEDELPTALVPTGECTWLSIPSRG